MVQKVHGRMRIGTVEKLFAEMLNVRDLKVEIRDAISGRDIRDDAKVVSLRKLNRS